MVTDFFQGLIEQIYKRIGKEEKNIVMARYNNDFSAANSKEIKRYSQREDGVFFAFCEFEQESFVGGYQPFLSIICEVYRKYIDGDFREFLEKCNVYELHKDMLESYYHTGLCKRSETILLDEVEYEQKRVTAAVAEMLRQVAQVCPIVVVINRYQLASRSILELTKSLFMNPCSNLGILLAANETKPKDSLIALWDELTEIAEDEGLMFRMGSSGLEHKSDIMRNLDSKDHASDDFIRQLQNMVELLDFEQALMYLGNIEKRIKFEDATMELKRKLKIYFLYIRTAIFSGDLSKAQELIADIAQTDAGEQQRKLDYDCQFWSAVCEMYQGRLDEAMENIKAARSIAEEINHEKGIFKADLLYAQVQMSGWFNIFFCVNDVDIPKSLIERLEKYRFINHLAHIYIYAYDNSPEVVAKTKEDERLLVNFSKGVEMAKQIGNEQLVYNAYEKNIMIASTNGRNEIALHYTVRSYQYMKLCRTLSEARVFTSIGYNLATLGINELAQEYYNRSLELYCYERKPEAVAEVLYNMSMNNIMLGRYRDAQNNLQIVLKCVERLHLNSLRVCNLSKVYALISLAYILQGDRFNCDRYLTKCRQFLNYVVDKEAKSDMVIHDYAMNDDDMFLYTFGKALYLESAESEEEIDNKEIEAVYAHAEIYLERSEGNQGFVYHLFRNKRMQFYKRIGKMDLYEKEKEILRIHEERIDSVVSGFSLDFLEQVDTGEYHGPCRVTDAELDLLIKQEGIRRDYATVKRQMDFISTWQKMIDVSDVNIPKMIKTAMNGFLNQFGNDRALYIIFKDKKAQVLYNDTKLVLDSKVLLGLEHAMGKYPQGFAVSKIAENFLEHLDVISYFGVDDVCSLVAVPFYKNDQLCSLLITYIKMKDNWHSSLNRYMLNEDDLNIYRLLFRDLLNSINRLEATTEVYEMNRRLERVAVTDLLTGIENRTGLYRRIEEQTAKPKRSVLPQAVSLMFLDLDNFKYYNDSFGHDVGDLMLIEMARIFKKIADQYGGFVCRYGGDEFIMVFETADKAFCERVAKKIYAEIESRDGFRKEVEEHLKHSVEMVEGKKLTCSMGISVTTDVEGARGIEELIHTADDILYSVKTTQKGTYKFI